MDEPKYRGFFRYRNRGRSRMLLGESLVLYIPPDAIAYIRYTLPAAVVLRNRKNHRARPALLLLDCSVRYSPRRG